jgi:HD-like signal output (HDOD) protein
VVSSADDSDAMELAVEVMKDANLTAKLLRLANSPFYNRGMGKITSVSRAVIMLGFETLKNMCITLKLIESFQHEHPGVDLDRVLVNAYLSAGFVREMAARGAIADLEESYICGLMYGLGEIIVAYTLSERYEMMITMRDKGDRKWSEIQRSMLGGSFAEIGQRLSRSWDFPNSVVDTMKPYNHKGGAVRNKKDLNHALAALSHDTLQKIYIEKDLEGMDFSHLMSSLGEVAGIERGDVEKSLMTSFRQSCELAEDFGLDRKLLTPLVSETEDGLLNRTLRQCSYYATTRGDIADLIDEPVCTEDTAATADNDQVEHEQQQQEIEEATLAREVSTYQGNIDPIKQLQALQEITALITENAGVHRVFSKVAEGIHEGAGLERVALCLLSADQSQLIARLVLGSTTEVLKEYFVLPVRDRKNLFIKLLLEGDELLINDIDGENWGSTIPREYYESVSSNGFVCAALRAGTRPVGLFYADNGISGARISNEAHRAFSQFVSQARLALQYSEMARSAK